MNPIPLRPPGEARPARFTRSLWFVLLAFSLAGCSRPKIKEAQSLAKSGQDRFDQIASFYGELIQHNQDYLSLNRLQDAEVPGTTPNAALAAALANQNEALRRRQAVALAFKKVYARLGTLVADSTTSGVTDAFTGLQTEVEALNHHPLTVTVPGVSLPPDLFHSWITKLQTDLVQTEQVRGFRAKAAKFDPAVSRFEKLFAREVPAYAGLSELYESKRYAIAKRLSDKNFTDLSEPASALEGLLDAYNLKLTPDVLNYPALRLWSSGTLKEKSDALILLHRDDAEGLDGELLSLVRTQEEFLNLPPLKDSLPAAPPAPAPPTPAEGNRP